MVEDDRRSVPLAPSLALQDHDVSVTVRGAHLTIPEVVCVARQGALVRLTTDEDVLHRVAASCDYVTHAVATGQLLYGVTTGFGGMANGLMAPEDVVELQQNLVWFLKAGAGRRLPTADVRAAMLLRANSHLRGASGVRLELIRRLVTFLNAHVTPHVHEFGSIGASGDLVPLASIAGALIGLDASCTVDFNGEHINALMALERLRLPPLHLHPKEGLAMVNGTSMMTGIAANCVYDTQVLLALGLGAHALAIQALGGTTQSFHPFVHAHKPHPGQMWTAERMRHLLAGSQLIRTESAGGNSYSGHGLVQDRYSVRCLPQFLGPIVDGITQIARQIEVEMNAATDNPLIDVDQHLSYQSGNFLGQYVGVGMDHLRYYIGFQASGRTNCPPRRARV
jgi:phenylalanine ammonia-lyase